MQLRELELRYRTRDDLPQPKSLESPAAVAPVVAELVNREIVEVFGILCLNTRHAILCSHLVSRGGLDATVVHPRDVFRAGILAGAAAVILYHNHPSGDPTPSRDDSALTRRMVTAGDLVGITVIDHIIIGSQDRYYSFKEAGRM
jgi:DNA repair protein RadC